MATYAIQCVESCFANNNKEDKGKENEAKSTVKKEGSNSYVVGEIGGKTVATCLEEIELLADLKHRRPKNQWWLPLADLCRNLSWPEMYKV